MKPEQILDQLETLGDASMRTLAVRTGAEHELALALWRTGNLGAGLTAPVTACIAAPLAMLLWTLCGAEGTPRTAMVASIALAVTVSMARRPMRAADGSQAPAE